ncbi:MAG: hypothetical protein KDK34_12220, partial [Leptospiraceae bacterium]|nr:hypothetical protein [Leptospiraceae bacterium]
GYGITSYLERVHYVTGSIGVSLYGFSVAFNTSYRPDIRFHDTDNGGLIDDSSAVAFLGSSSRADGLVTNNKYAYGYLNQIFLSNLNNTATGLNTLNPFTGYTYSYTPRQKLPKWVNWISVSYSFSI